MPTLGVDSIKIVVGGRIASVQTWSFGLRVKVAMTGFAYVQSELDAIANLLVTPTATMVSALKGNIWAADTTYNSLAVYAINIGTGKSYLVSRPTVVSQVGSAPNPAPSLISLVASLRTAVPGRSGRGRLYVPCTAGPFGTDHQASLTNTTAVSQALAAWITAINGAAFPNPPTTSHSAVVGSFRNSNVNPITRVVCDSIPDVQHRRSDKLLATNVVSTNV